MIHVYLEVYLCPRIARRERELCNGAMASVDLALDGELDDSGLLRILNPKSSEKPKTKSASVTHMAEKGMRSLRSKV